jgi:hypothetical protein
MSFKDAFLDFLKTGRRRRTIEESPYGRPGLFKKDADFILNAQLGGKWADVEYYGPGAAEANERRAVRLGINPTGIMADPGQTSMKKKRRRLSKRERLEHKLAQLQADVEKLEKGGK